MYEIKNLTSVSLFVGTGACNAKCAHCAGLIHRPFAPKKDGVVDEARIVEVLRDCYERGARYLSLSSSGEPTLSPKSVTKTLEIVSALSGEGISFSPINLYTNGIRIGEDKTFAERFLPLWRGLGLTTLYVTVHSINLEKNAKVYGVQKYPELQIVFSRIYSAGLKIRANVVLSRTTICTFDEFARIVSYLEIAGVDSISAWPVRGQDDQVDTTLAPPEEEMEMMKEWVNQRPDKKCPVRLLWEKSPITHDDKKKLTLFPNDVLSSTWCT
jgi:molybdenum cofactor biosynthesis enzyme MoaA